MREKGAPMNFCTSRFFRLLMTFALLAMFLAPDRAMAAPSPTDQVREAVDQILRLLKDPDLPSQVRNQRIQDLVRDRFDFQTMSQWILGIHWRQATPDQRQRFVDLFTQLLETTYRDRIDEYADRYNDEQVEYVEERIIKDRAKVDTLVVTTDKKIPISYKMILENDQWRVYDVIIEDVSLVRNYRSTYGEIISKEGFDSLFQRLEKKIDEIKTSEEGKPSGTAS